MSTPKELTDPPLRKMWSDAKKAAEKKAKQKKQDKIFKPLDKSFNEDLGPELKKWPDIYPNLGAMGTKKGQIERVLSSYRKKVIAEKALDAQVKKTLTDALASIGTELETRLEKAEELILGDEDTALKQAIKESLNPTPRIEVLTHPDISRLVKAKKPKTVAIDMAPFEMKIVLENDEVLKKIDANDGNARERIQSAANFEQVITDIASVYGKLDKIVAADPAKFDAANQKFGEAVGAIMKAATDRAGDEFKRLVGVRAQYRNYKIKSGVKLSLAIAGTAAGAVSIACAPFAPVMLVNAVGLIKAASEIGQQIGKLSLKVEEAGNLVRKDVDDLTERYKSWPGFDVGSVEVGVTLVNAISPTFFKTISGCEDGLKLFDDKISGLEVRASDMSVKLNEVLDAQKQFESDLVKWIQASKGGMTPAIKKKVTEVNTQYKVSLRQVTSMFDEVVALNERIDKTRSDCADLTKKVSALSAKEPTIAKFAEVFINTSANVGFLVSANVGWEDPYKVVETTKAVTDMIGNVSGSLDGALSLAEDLKGLVDEVRKG